MQRIWCTSVAVVVVFVLAQGVAQAQSLQGTWQMEELDGTEYATTRVNPQGLWILGETHYSYLLLEFPEERQRLGPPETPGQPTDAERIAFSDHLRFFLAQTGTYEVQGTTLIYHPIIGRIEGPNGYPEEVRQELEFEGNDTVWLTGPPGGTRRKFTRVE